MIATLEPVVDQSSLQAAYQNIPGFERITMQYLPPGRLLERLLAREAAGRLSLLMRDRDVVHVHGIWRPHLLQATRVSSTNGRPCIISPHGMLSTWSMSQKSLKKKAALSLGWRAALERAACVHVLNRDEADAVSLVCNPQRVVTLPNGVNLSEVICQPEGEMVWQRFPALRGIRYIVFVGRLHYSKGLDVLASTFALVADRVPDVHLVVLGPEFGAGRFFRDQIRRRGLASRVHVLGGVYGTDKAALIRHAQCFCLPSRQEGFSMAIVEAMALGLPVVISDCCHFPEVAEAGAGEVVSLNEHAVAAALVRLLLDDGLRSRCGTAARELSLSSYQWTTIARGFLEVYARTYARSGSETPRAA
jgi:glycosyltransferase involved in cell wall biosynthesis